MCICVFMGGGGGGFCMKIISFICIILLDLSVQ